MQQNDGDLLSRKSLHPPLPIPSRRHCCYVLASRHESCNAANLLLPLRMPSYGMANNPGHMSAVIKLQWTLTLINVRASYRVAPKT